LEGREFVRMKKLLCFASHWSIESAGKRSLRSCRRNENQSRKSPRGKEIIETLGHPEIEIARKKINLSFEYEYLLLLSG
jgi:hypothetical protein